MSRRRARGVCTFVTQAHKAQYLSVTLRGCQNLNLCDVIYERSLKGNKNRCFHDAGEVKHW